MTNQKRLSQVSLAAIALLAAALPCLAQTELSNRRNALQTAQTNEIAILHNERHGVVKAEPKATSADNANAKSANASRNKLNEGFALATSSTASFSSHATISESDWQKTRRVRNAAESTATRTITFVPSRGQKLPD